MYPTLLLAFVLGSLATIALHSCYPCQYFFSLHDVFPEKLMKRGDRRSQWRLGGLVPCRSNRLHMPTFSVCEMEALFTALLEETW